MEDELWFAYLEQVAWQEKASAAEAAEPAKPDKPDPAKAEKQKPAPPSPFACEELPSE
jgi:hypothetical protein